MYRVDCLFVVVMLVESLVTFFIHGATLVRKHAFVGRAAARQSVKNELNLLPKPNSFGQLVTNAGWRTGCHFQGQRKLLRKDLSTQNSALLLIPRMHLPSLQHHLNRLFQKHTKKT